MQSDLSRAIQHEPDQSWPTEVKVQLIWIIDGHPHVRTFRIEAEQFFGTQGAPIEGAALIGMIENLRRQGPPDVERIVRGKTKRR